MPRERWGILFTLLFLSFLFGSFVHEKKKFPRNLLKLPMMIILATLKSWSEQIVFHALDPFVIRLNFFLRMDGIDDAKGGRIQGRMNRNTEWSFFSL